MNEAPKKSVCLACSSGGHLNQLVELVPRLENLYDVMFVTTERQDAIKRLQNDNVKYLPDVSKSNISQLLKSIRITFRILQKSTPSIIVTNGAGAVFTYVFIARYLYRVPIILIESIARINNISMFGRFVAIFAARYYVQWEELEKLHKKSQYSGIIFDLPTGIKIQFPKITKSILIITGTSEYPFPRIVEWTQNIIAQYEINPNIIIQSGATELIGSFDAKQWMSHSEMLDAIDSADMIITHAGSGAIINAVKKHKYVICIPRRAINNEHNDDHQIEISRKFEELGYIRSAYTYEEYVDIFSKKIPLNYPESSEEILQNRIIEDIDELLSKSHTN